MNHLSDIGIEKYGLGAFQRRIGCIHTMSGHDFRRLYTCIQTRLKSAEPLTNPSFWLHFGAIYHAIRQSRVPTFMGLHLLGKFFTYWNISEPPDKIWRL